MNTRRNAIRLQPVDGLLVCLDLTGIDPYLIRYAAGLARTLCSGKVVFFHAIQAYDLPDRHSRDFPDVKTELRQIIQNAIHESVDHHFEHDCDWEIVIRVAREDAAREVMEYARGAPSDLTVIGQKSGQDREARYGRKIALGTDGDVLFLPKGCHGPDAPVLCAVDFSDASLKAFERSLDLSRARGVPLVCYAVSDAARAYFPASTDRSASQDQRRSQKAFEAFLDQYDLSGDQVSCRIEASDPAASEADQIYAAALQENAGLIVVGAAGKKSRQTSVLGNLCACFWAMEKEVPVMVVADEGPKRPGTGGLAR